MICEIILLSAEFINCFTNSGFYGLREQNIYTVENNFCIEFLLKKKNTKNMM